MSISEKTNHLICKMHKKTFIVLFIHFFQISLNAQDSTIVAAQSDTLLEEIKDKYSIIGKVAYGNGVIVGDAEVTLLDTVSYTHLTLPTRDLV